MARRIPRVPFKPDGPFVARRIFTFNGAHTIPGEPFPHDGVKVRRLRSLYLSRHIEMMDIMMEMSMRMQAAAAEMDAEPTPPPPPPEPEPTPEPEVDNAAMLERTAKLKAAVLATEPKPEPAADWRQLDDKALLAHAFKVTGTRRRNAQIAREELERLENGVNTDRAAS